MQQELRKIPAGRGMIEQCFGICWRYLSDLSRDDTITEIAFKKTVLPFFLAEAEYYKFLSFADHFKPAHPLEQYLFWQREAGRLNRFKVQHREFLDYISSGCTCLDADYFLDETAVSILCGYYSLLRYNEYAQGQLRLLAGTIK